MTTQIKGMGKMKVLAINGSARRDGNTAILLNTVLEECRKAGIDTELIQFGGSIIEPCKACWACGGKGNCVHHHDQFQDVFTKMTKADGILLGSPAYAANVSANMQAFLERSAMVADMNPGLFNHKIGAAVAAARRGGALQTIDIMNHFFLDHEMYIVGSAHWNVVYGQLPGDVRMDVEGMGNLKKLGQNLAHFLKDAETLRALKARRPAAFGQPRNNLRPADNDRRYF